MKLLTVKFSDSDICEWIAEYNDYEVDDDFDVDDDNALYDLVIEDFNDYRREVLADPSSYSDYPDREDYYDEEEFLSAVEEFEEELDAELGWWVVEVKQVKEDGER